MSLSRLHLSVVLVVMFKHPEATLRIRDDLIWFDLLCSYSSSDILTALRWMDSADSYESPRTITPPIHTASTKPTV